MSSRGSHSGVELLFLAMAEVWLFSLSFPMKEGVKTVLVLFTQLKRGLVQGKSYVSDYLLVLVPLLVQCACECKVD